MPRAQDDDALRKAQDDDLVMNLVELALSRPPDMREDFLRSACAGDAELFNQVWDYVQWNHRMQDFLLEPLYPALREHRFDPGELLADRFRIVREVAQGGMGVVYEAEDERLGRRIALKCAKSGFRKRLPPEVRHASEISHPNVCKIFEIHTTSTPDGDIDFLTMEYLEGDTLAARLSRGRLPEAEARAIGRQICAGLAEAHRHHVVHGDLKSNNVILTRAGDGSVRAVITDFGLARRPLGPGGDYAVSSAASAAGSSQAAGTPDYMAPELWKGEKPSSASDVYALGVILYELVANQRPYKSEIPWQERQKQKLTPVHHAWSPTLQRCLDADPSKRFQDAADVGTALEPSRSRLRWAAAAAAVALAVASGVVTYQRATAPKESWRLAMLPIESSSDVAALAGDLSQDLAGQLGRLKGGSVARLTFVDASHIVREAQRATHTLRATLTKENNKLLLHAVLTDARTGANVKEWAAAYPPGEVRRYAPVALAGMVTGTLRLPPLAVAAVNSAAAKDYWAGVWYTRQNSTLDSALGSLQRAVTEDPDSPLPYAALAEAQWYEYRFTRDQAWLDHARESLRQAEGRNPDVPGAHRVEGYLHYNEGFYEQAVPEFERAIELQPGNAMAHMYLGKTYEDNAQLDKALAEFLKASEVEPQYFATWQNLGAYYQNRSNFTEMARYHKKAVDLARNEPNLHRNLGAAFIDLGRFHDAETEYRRSLDLGKTQSAEYDLGLTLMYENRALEAVEHFKEALKFDSQQFFTPRYLVLMYLGIAERQLGDVAAADKDDQEGLNLAKGSARRNSRDGEDRAYLGYFKAALSRDRRDAEDAEDDINFALGLSKDHSEVRWTGVLAYEELYRKFRNAAYRDQTLIILRQSGSDQISDVSRWPDLRDLHEDPAFKQLLSGTLQLK